MNCPGCGEPLKIKKKKQRQSGAVPMLLELIGILLIIFTFFTIIGPIIGFIFLLLGHSAAYKKVKIGTCKACDATYPVE